VTGIPEAARLVEAVREWIEGTVLPTADGQMRFHARVAANTLAIVERELTMGSQPSAAEELGFASERAVAEAIRSGALDDRAAEVARALRDAARRALGIDDPSHLGKG
jgi:hypothetical protein